MLFFSDFRYSFPAVSHHVTPIDGSARTTNHIPPASSVKALGRRSLLKSVVNVSRIDAFAHNNSHGTTPHSVTQSAAPLDLASFSSTDFAFHQPPLNHYRLQLLLSLINHRANEIFAFRPRRTILRHRNIHRACWRRFVVVLNFGGLFAILKREWASCGRVPPSWKKSLAAVLF